MAAQIAAAVEGVPVVDVQGQVNLQGTEKPEHVDQKPAPQSIEDMLREVSASLRENMTSGRQALIDQKHADYQKISDYIQGATRALDSFSKFETDRLPTIRTIAELQSILRGQQEIFARIIHEGTKITESTLSMMQNEGPNSGGKIRQIFSALSDRAMDAARDLRTATPAYTEQVFLREVADARIGKIASAETKLLLGLNYELEHGSANLPNAAKAFIQAEVAKRLSKLFDPVRADPMNGRVDPLEVEARLKEVASFAAMSQIKIPGAEERFAIGDSLRRRLDAIYRMAQGTLDQELKPKESMVYFKGTDAYAKAALDDLGRGTVTFYHSASDRSKVVFTVGDKEPNHHRRVEAMRNILATMQNYEGLDRDGGAKWNLLAVRYVHDSLSQLSSNTEVTYQPHSLDLSPSKFRVTLGQVAKPGQEAGRLAREVMEGTSCVIVSPSDDISRTLRILQKGGQLLVELNVSQPGGSENLYLAVETTTSTLKHNDELKDTYANLGRAFARLGSESIKADGYGITDELLGIRDAHVTSVKGLQVAPEADVLLKLAPKAEVRGVEVAGGARVRFVGERADISGVVGRKGSIVDVQLKNSELSDWQCALLAGTLENCRLDRVGANSVTNHSSDSVWAQPGAKLTDNMCSLDGCQWKVALGSTARNLKTMYYLKRTEA